MLKQHDDNKNKN